MLCFYGYFKEAVHESSVENHRIRNCELHYYLEDNTFEIVEKRVENSGVPQGTFAKRQRIIKDALSDTYMTYDDIQLGGTLSVYGRNMFVTDCNASTRAWLSKSGRPDELLVPVAGEEDLYTTMRAEFMSRETGRDETVSFVALFFVVATQCAGARANPIWKTSPTPTPTSHHTHRCNYHVLVMLSLRHHTGHIYPPLSSLITRHTLPPLRLHTTSERTQCKNLQRLGSEIL